VTRLFLAEMVLHSDAPARSHTDVPPPPRCSRLAGCGGKVLVTGERIAIRCKTWFKRGRYVFVAQP
jgi:hypothetical protein